MSSEVQRLIRKMQPKGPRSLDEHVWPIYVAIVVLFGYLAGVIVSVLHFNDSRLHANATTWLLALSAAAIVGLFCVRFLKQRLLKRTLVLSLLLSVIVNVSLLIMLAWTSILYRPWQENETKVAVQEQREDVVVPEYPLFNEDPQQRVPQEYEKPVETGEPEAEKRIELTRQSTVPEVELTENPPIPNASTMEQQEVASTPKRFDAPSAPRQSQTASKLSRQDLKSELTVNRSAYPTSNSPATEQSAAKQTQAAAVQPRKRELETERPATDSDADQAPERVRVAQLARRDANDSEAVSMSTLPKLKRRLNQPQHVPTTDTPIDDQLTKSERTQRDVEASSTLVKQQRTTSAPEEMQSVDLQPQVATDLQRQTRIDRPESSTLSPAMERSALAKATTNPTEVETPNVSPTESQSSEANPTSSQVAKQSDTRVSDAAPETTSVQPSETRPQVSASTLARAKAETNPSVSKTLANATSPTRSKNLASSPSRTNTQVDGAVAVDSNLLNLAAMPEPSRLALSRSSIGIAGVGDASNLERGVAAPESPVSMASASANRAEAQQEMEEAFALSPSVRSPSRQMRATANQPQTSMQAQPIDTAMVSGATAPAQAAASSAATVERSPSNASEASLTAAKGTTEVDLGPTRIAADTGNGRAEGGGQPEISSGELARALSKANSLAGASGLRTSTEANASSPAARDLASDADTAGQTATATTTEIARSTGGRGSALDRNDTPQAPSSTDDLANLPSAGGSRASDQSDLSASQIASGGNRKAGRRARGLQLKSDTSSSVPSLASADVSGGSSRGEPLDAQGTRARQSATGLPGQSSDEIGAAEADLVVAGDPGGLDAPVFSRQDGGSEAEDGAFAASDSNRGALSRKRRASLSGGSTNVELDPEEFAVNTPGTNQDDSLEGSGLDGELLSAVTRQGGGAIPVDIDALDGPGGLGDELAPNTGILSRSASPDSDFVSMQPARFLSRARPGASIAAKTDVVTPTKAFRRRIIRQGEELAGERGLPSPKTEAAIELGLVFLSKYQSVDGSWSFNNFADGKTVLPDDETALIVSDTGATGLSLLSFLGAGYHHKDDKYQEHVKNGLDFLVQHQQKDGDLYIDQDPNSSRSAWLYSHAIATIALCEAYGMTQDPTLRRPAQKAVNFIVESQHPTRGGWRYSPAYGADTSVTGWMTMALKSGELSGLNVDKTAFSKIEHWMDLAQASDEQPFLFRYNPYAADTATQRHGLKPTRAMTAVGLLMRLYTGWGRSDPKMMSGAETLVQNLPATGTSDRPRRDTYYWYYATQVMYHMGGDYWQAWNQALHPMLTTSQVQDGPLAGSWDPQVPVPDRWGTYGGRLYVTTLNLLSLEVFYRHLPIYEDTAK